MCGFWRCWKLLPIDVIHKSIEVLVNSNCKNKNSFINNQESHSYYIKVEFQLTIINRNYKLLRKLLWRCSCTKIHTVCYNCWHHLVRLIPSPTLPITKPSLSKRKSIVKKSLVKSIEICKTESITKGTNQWLKKMNYWFIITEIFIM